MELFAYIWTDTSFYKVLLLFYCALTILAEVLRKNYSRIVKTSRHFHDVACCWMLRLVAGTNCGDAFVVWIVAYFLLFCSYAYTYYVNKFFCHVFDRFFQSVYVSSSSFLQLLQVGHVHQHGTFGFNYFAPFRGAKYCDQRFCMYVCLFCLFVCLSVHSHI